MMIIKKDSKIVKAKREGKCFALKAKKESSDEECSTFRSQGEKYTLADRDFKKFFKRRECPKTPKDKILRAFVRGSWSDSGIEEDEKAKDETCLIAQESNKVCFDSSYFSDEDSSIEEAIKLTKFEKSTHCLNDMLSNKKHSKDKLGLRFNSLEASTSGTKEIKFVKYQKERADPVTPPDLGGIGILNIRGRYFIDQ
nr:hypothetical protein [Tanacetum cinerariifolium]